MPILDKHPKIRKTILYLCAALCAVAAAALPTATARAAGGLSISTSYPGVTVNAGEDVSFTLTVANNSSSGQNIALSVPSLPEGWSSIFKGAGQPISRVYVDAKDTVSVTYVATVPADAAEGSYKILLQADAENGASDTLELELNVTEQELTQGELSSQYPTLQGWSSATFEFAVDLVNNSSEPQSYSLSASTPGDGWEVSFKPAYENNQIASLSVDAGATEGLSVTVKPPQSVTAGEYTITCSAVSAAETLKTDLTVIITGTYDISLSTPSGLLSVDAYAGRKSTVTMSVSNTGSSDLQNVSLTASAPAGWTVTFDEKTIELLAAGETKQINATIEPSPEAITGDYVVGMTASTTETRSECDLRVAVKTSTVWGIVGIVIILALAAGLFVLFRKFGRR